MFSVIRDANVFHLLHLNHNAVQYKLTIVHTTTQFILSIRRCLMNVPISLISRQQHTKTQVLFLKPSNHKICDIPCLCHTTNTTTVFQTNKQTKKEKKCNNHLSCEQCTGGRCNFGSKHITVRAPRVEFAGGFMLVQCNDLTQNHAMQTCAQCAADSGRCAKLHVIELKCFPSRLTALQR